MKGKDVMNKKVLIGVIAGAVAVAATAGIFAVVVSTLNYRPSTRTDIWDDDDDEDEDEIETSYYRDNPDPTPTTPRETQGRDYYENGGFKGWDSYYIIQDLTTEDIIGVYEHYHDLAHAYDFEELKNFDQELEHPAYSQVDASGYGVFMFYDLILADEKIDHVESFNVIGTESTGAVEFSMKMRIHDGDKAMEIYNAFVDRYSEGAQGSEYYNMLNTFDKGVRITVDESHDWIVCFKKVRSQNDYFWLIYVSEDY